MASPVCVASCSVESTMSRAMGTIASAAEKNSTGGGTCASSNRMEIGMKASSQLIDGLRESAMVLAGGHPRLCVIQAVYDCEKESGGPTTHQDAREGLHPA